MVEEQEEEEDEADASEEMTEEEDTVPDRVYTEADFEGGKNALAKIVGCIVPEATITLEIKNSHVLFNVEGEKAAMLIGKHGQTLKAMQHVVEKIVHKSCGERVRVMVDVEQYLEKRRASLKSLATKMADKVKQTGKPSTINRMDAFERKIIHDALRKNKHVKTRSAGGGEIRNVVIHPGKKNWRPKKAQAK
jgi:spoIIIJ-associated protein